MYFGYIQLTYIVQAKTVVDSKQKVANPPAKAPHIIHNRNVYPDAYLPSILPEHKEVSKCKVTYKFNLFNVKKNSHVYTVCRVEPILHSGQQALFLNKGVPDNTDVTV